MAFVAIGVLVAGPLFARQSRSDQQNMTQRHDMECSHYMGMNAAGQTAAVELDAQQDARGEQDAF